MTKMALVSQRRTATVDSATQLVHTTRRSAPPMPPVPHGPTQPHAGTLALTQQHGRTHAHANTDTDINQPVTTRSRLPAGVRWNKLLHLDWVPKVVQHVVQKEHVGLGLSVGLEHNAIIWVAQPPVLRTELWVQI